MSPSGDDVRLPGGDRLELAPAAAPPGSDAGGILGKLKRGLLMTHTEVIERLDAAVRGRAAVDDDLIEYLEETLIESDLGVEASLEVARRVGERLRPGEAGDPLRLRQLLEDEVSVLLFDAPAPPPVDDGPLVTLVVGVNGVGKTTTIAKLAAASRRSGRRVLLAAADTFRAAAIEQLEIWGDRLGVGVVRQQLGADPGAVVYDALAAGRARGIDDVFVDTAGRLHNQEHLMAELAKIRRVIERAGDGFASRTLLVLDATTGQNAVAQARAFRETAAIDALVLTKLDGTAKGGMVVAIARELRLPVVHLGVGEALDDLVPFRPREFAAALFR